jgi:hypothetical protein
MFTSYFDFSPDALSQHAEDCGTQHGTDANGNKEEESKE